MASIALMYHRVCEQPGPLNVCPSTFERQMEWLAGCGRPVLTLEEAAVEGFSTRSVVLTLDDGFVDNHTHALPILRRHGLAATLFLVSGAVGGMAEWHDEPDAPMLSWPQVREMAGEGIEIASHTQTHLDLRDAGAARVEEELVDSKADIEARIEREVSSFAYPYGYTGSDSSDALMRAGYSRAVLAATWGVNTPTTDPFMLHRVPIVESDGPARFAAKARGWYGFRCYTSKLAREARWYLSRIRSRRDGH